MKTGYAEAIKAFSQNMAIIKQPAADPLGWNLAAGLMKLTEAIHADLRDLDRRLERVEKEVQNLPRSK